MLETLEKVDKTGTLTEGRPKLTECVAASPFSEEAVVRFAASVEQNSEHPLAHAIVQGAKERGVTVPTVAAFDSVTGGGVHGTVEGKNVVIDTELLTVDQLADRLHVRPRTVQAWSRQKRIPTFRLSAKVVRFDWLAVLATLRNQAQQREAEHVN